MDKYTFPLLRIALIAMFCGAVTKADAQPRPNGSFAPIEVGSISVNAGAGFGVPYNGSIGVPFGVKV